MRGTRGGEGEGEGRTELHRRLEVRAAEAHHDRIGVAVDDGRVVVVPVGRVVPVLHLLHSRSSSSISSSSGEERSSPSTTRNADDERTCLVLSIISRPYAVTDIEMGKHGSLPTVAPVKPYTELAETCATRTASSALARGRTQRGTTGGENRERDAP